MLTQAGVMIQPPKRRPCEHDVARTGAPQSLQFAQCNRVGGGWSPITAILFEKGKHSPVAEGNFLSPLIVVHEDERVPRRNEVQDFFLRELQVLKPPFRIRRTAR